MFMFALNENVVYPGYGVARVSRILERTMGLQVTHFYELKFLHKDMTILVPVDNLAAVGVRVLSTLNCVKSVIKMLETALQDNAEAHLDANTSSWNKRNKRYQALLRNGDLIEISKVYRDLQCLALTKDLSFGERALLLQTESLLAEEIAIVEQSLFEQKIVQLRSFFVPGYAIPRKEPVQVV